MSQFRDPSPLFLHQKVIYVIKMVINGTPSLLRHGKVHKIHRIFLFLLQKLKKDNWLHFNFQHYVDTSRRITSYSKF